MATEYLFGINAIHETIIAAPHSVREIIVSENANHGRRQTLLVEARRLGLRVSVRSARELDRLAQGQRHQGMVAVVEAYAYPPFEELLQRIANADVREWILILDGITSQNKEQLEKMTLEVSRQEHQVYETDLAAILKVMKEMQINQ